MHNRVRHKAGRDERLCKQLGSVERYAMVGKMRFLWLFDYFAVATSVEKIILELRAVHLRAWHNSGHVMSCHVMVLSFIQPLLN